jgi:hypothetical protein
MGVNSNPYRRLGFASFGDFKACSFEPTAVISTPTGSWDLPTSTGSSGRFLPQRAKADLVAAIWLCCPGFKVIVFGDIEAFSPGSSRA